MTEKLKKNVHKGTALNEHEGKTQEERTQIGQSARKSRNVFEAQLQIGQSARKSRRSQRMKKKLSLLLVSVMALFSLLAGCGSKSVSPA